MPLATVELQPDERDAVRQLIRAALWEDLRGEQDVTTQALVPAEANSVVNVVARKSGVLAGSEIAAMVFAELDEAVDYSPHLQDGSLVEPGTLIASIAGSARSLLTGERTALNFLTLLSGTATLTRQFVDAVAGTKAQILDTRKTLPGLRALQKYAVRCGGGVNHRFGLYDAILIKDNHLAWWTASTGQGIADAVRHARRAGGVSPPMSSGSNPAADAGMILEVEVDTLGQLEDALPAEPDIVLLDNMTVDQMRDAVKLRDRVAPRVLLEASGGITLERAAAIAATGVDRISIGGLTHSAPALDIGFDWQPG